MVARYQNRGMFLILLIRLFMNFIETRAYIGYQHGEQNWLIGFEKEQKCQPIRSHQNQKIRHVSFYLVEHTGIC